MSQIGDYKRKLRIPKTQYVSFDVFDTLIKRNVAMPSDLFRLMERTYSKTGFLPEGYAQKRIEAEIKAKEEASSPVSIDQIYRVLEKEYGEQVNEWKKAEIKTEYEMCCSNYLCADLLNRCLEAGKNIVLISDMYLSSAVIDSMLKKCGVSGYSKLYVSCEYGARKSNGSLFKLVMDDLNIKPHQITHIGDSKRSDFLVPLSLGMHAVHVPNAQKKLCKKNKNIANDSALTYRTIKACCSNKIVSMSEVEAMGCTILGPLLAGYSRWLAEKLKKENIQDVYFLSRDGWMLKRAFDALKINGISTHYLYASRRSYLAPTIWMHPDFDDVIARQKQLSSMNLSIFLRRIGLKPELYAHKAELQGLELEQYYRHFSFWKSESIKNFYDSIKPDVVCQSKKEYEAVLAYFKSCQFPAKIAIADVGYRGTIQNLLCELLNADNAEKAVKGYYIALDQDSDLVRANKIDAEDYLSNTCVKDNYYKYVTTCAALFESQFLKAEGSVDFFCLKDAEPQIRFKDYEYGSCSNNINICDEINSIEKYQSGAIALINAIQSGGKCLTFPIEPDAAIYNWLRFAYHPSLHDVRLWGDFHYEDGNIYCFAKPQKWCKYICHPGLLKKDFLNNSRWKIGFMKRLMKIPFPYEKMYRMLHEIYNYNKKQ